MIDLYASEGHFADHLAAVWRALPVSARGAFVAHGSTRERLRDRRITSVGDIVGRPDVPILVASIGDLRRARQAGRERVALMEHGAGQSYGGDRRSDGHPSYAGGLRRDADLFLHPGEHPAARDRERYPDRQVEVVGCPRLDALPARADEDGPVIAVSFHWDSPVAPETMSGFRAFREGVRDLARRHRVIGHAHPRIIDRLAGWYERHGIEVVRSFDEVCRRADVYVCDNSSTLFEFASTARPVVTLSPPWYRRQVAHGLRFWDAIPGLECPDGASLIPVVEDALDDPSVAQRAREDALSRVYAHRRGAARRAARVLARWAGAEGP